MATDPNLKNELEDTLQDLATAYRQKHNIATSSFGRFFGIDRHYDMIQILIKQAHDIKNTNDKNNFIDNTLIEVFEAGAKTAFPNMQPGIARAEFVNKLNNQPNDHLFYRTIGLIIKDSDKDEVYKDIDQIKKVSSNLHQKL